MSPTETPARRSVRWPLIIVSLLGGHVALMVGAVMIATNDRSFAVTPDYYQRAVNWDREQADRRASEALGWRVAVETSPRVDPLGRRAVAFVLTDARGRAVDGATLDVAYFHHAHAYDRQKLADLTPDPDAATRFTRRLPMRHAGMWEFRFTAKAGGKTFVATQTQVIANADTAAGAGTK